jgi:glycyl-tRNA synthetase beta chain
LVEWPKVYTGQFDAQFLEVPQTALIAVMEQHQRYFPVLNEEGALLPYFLLVSHIQPEDPTSLIQGNERVIVPRFSDAQFFYQQDLKLNQNDALEQLDRVVWQDGLGTLKQKAERLKALTYILAGLVNNISEDAQTAGLLAKSDLVTGLVGEFPELQGVYGAHLAKLRQDPLSVVTALKYQYARSPQTLLEQESNKNNIEMARVLVIADRLDHLVGLFGIGKEPTADKDPFGLRRAAIDLIDWFAHPGFKKHSELDFSNPISHWNTINLGLWITNSFNRFKEQGFELKPDTQSRLISFILDRLKSWYQQSWNPVNNQNDQVHPLMIDAVIARMKEESSDFQKFVLADCHQRIIAVAQFTQLDSDKVGQLIQLNKRVVNMLEKQSITPIQSDCYDANEFEHNLYQALLDYKDLNKNHTPDQQTLFTLLKLKDPLALFFENLMVLDPDQNIAARRLGLLKMVDTELKRVADLTVLQSLWQG